MDGLTNYAICKVCNHTTKYQPTDVFVGEDGKFYVYCEHCTNDIKIEKAHGED